MGYTHYFHTPKSLDQKRFDAFRKDAKKIVDHCQNELGIKIGDWGGKKKPEFKKNIVAFNGFGDELSHESFVVSKEIDTNDGWYTIDRNGLVFNFCKTNRKPYDVAVTATLIALKNHFPECIIKTDGNADDWKDGIELCDTVLGYGKLVFYEAPNRHLSFKKEIE